MAYAVCSWLSLPFFEVKNSYLQGQKKRLDEGSGIYFTHQRKERWLEEKGWPKRVAQISSFVSPKIKWAEKRVKNIVSPFCLNGEAEELCADRDFQTRRKIRFAVKSFFTNTVDKVARLGVVSLHLLIISDFAIGIIANFANVLTGFSYESLQNFAYEEISMSTLFFSDGYYNLIKLANPNAQIDFKKIGDDDCKGVLIKALNGYLNESTFSKKIRDSFPNLLKTPYMILIFFLTCGLAMPGDLMIATLTAAFSLVLKGKAKSVNTLALRLLRGPENVIRAIAYDLPQELFGKEVLMNSRFQNSSWYIRIIKNLLSK